MRNKITNGIYILSFVSIVVLLMIYGPRLTARNYTNELDIKDNLIAEIQFDINTLANKREEERLDKIEVMSDYFNSEYKLNNETTYNPVELKRMEDWMFTKEGLPYLLGAKGGGFLDCSGLFGAYAYYDKETISHNTLINHYSAELIRKNNIAKSFEDIQAGDLLYIMKNGKANHIMYVLGNDMNRILTYEANPDGVGHYEYRFIKGKGGIFLERNGKVYDYFITYNNLLEVDKPAEEPEDKYPNMELIGDFLISSYIPTTVGMNINNGGLSGRHTASGLPLKDEYAGKIVACPKIYDIGLNGTTKQKLYIEGHGVVECSDRGGLIVMKGEINSRGNVSSHNRLDLFAGMDSPKIEWNQKHANVYLIN